MRRVFENSVNPAHSTSIARPCDGGVSELFRSCFFALAMFSRRWRENIASVPAGLFSPFGLKTHGLQVRFAHPSKCALTRFARQRRANPASVPAGLLARWAKRTASRFASLTLRTSPRAGAARPGFRPAYFRPAGSKRTCSRFASLTLRTSPRAGYARPGFRPAYFRPLGSKRTASRSAKADPPNCAPCRRGPPGVPAGLLARWSKRTASRFASLTLRTAPRAGYARPGFRMAYFRPAGSKRTTSRSAGADPPNCAPRVRGPPGVPHGLFSPCGLKTHDLQVRFAPLRLRPVRAWPARGSAWLIFALWAQNAHAPGPLKRTLRTAPRAGAARPGFRPASRFAPGGRGFLSGADVENRPKRGILKLM